MKRNARVRGDRSRPSDATILGRTSRSRPGPPASVSSSTGAARAERRKTDLAFVRDGKPVKTLDRAALEKAVPAETWTAFDPYYNRPKTFRGSR